MSGKKETEKRQASRKNIGWDHPFVSAGFYPDHLLQDLWQFSNSYWEKWMAENLPKARSMNGVSWFHESQIRHLLCSQDVPPEEMNS